MTKITARKSKIRTETSATIRGRALIVELTPHTVKIREKGRRHSLEISWDSVYTAAAKKEAERLHEEKKNKRKEAKQ